MNKKNSSLHEVVPKMSEPIIHSNKKYIGYFMDKLDMSLYNFKNRFEFTDDHSSHIKSKLITLHKNKILHGDIFNPHNIMAKFIDENIEWFIIDFGKSKIIEDTNDIRFKEERMEFIEFIDRLTKKKSKSRIKSRTPNGTSNNTPRTFQNTPRTHKKTSRTLQYTPRTLQNTPRTHKKTSRTLQNTPRTHQKTSRTLQNTPRTHKKTSRTLQYTSRTLQNTPRTHKKTSRTLQYTPRTHKKKPKTPPKNSQKKTQNTSDTRTSVSVKLF